MKLFKYLSIIMLTCLITSFHPIHHHIYHRPKTYHTFNKTKIIHKKEYSKTYYRNGKIFLIINPSNKFYRYNNQDYILCPKCKKVLIKPRQYKCSRCLKSLL